MIGGCAIERALSILGIESLETSTVKGTEPTGALNSLSSVPIIQKQIFDPVEE